MEYIGGHFWTINYIDHKMACKACLACKSKGPFYLVANCNVINCHLFCFQNCNKRSNKFPKLTLFVCHTFTLSICPRGINTLLVCPAYSSQFSISNVFIIASSISKYSFISYHPLPIPSNYPIYQSLQKSNMNIISKEIIGLSNRINDLPEDICISRKVIHTIEL